MIFVFCFYYLFCFTMFRTFYCFHDELYNERRKDKSLRKRPKPEAAGLRTKRRGREDDSSKMDDRTLHETTYRRSTAC